MYDIQIAGLTVEETKQLSQMYPDKEIGDVSECQTDLIAVVSNLIILNLLKVDRNLGLDEMFDFDFGDFSKYAIIEDLIDEYYVGLFDTFDEVLYELNF